MLCLESWLPTEAVPTLFLSNDNAFYACVCVCVRVGSVCMCVWICVCMCGCVSAFVGPPYCNSAMLCAFICVVYEKPTTHDGMPLLSPPPPLSYPPPSPESSSVAKLEGSWLCSLKNRTNDLSEPQHNKPSCHTLYTDNCCPISAFIEPFSSI